MTLGTPVVTSNVSSLPEVAGNAALTIDPNQPIELAEAIYQFISDKLLHHELINRERKTPGATIFLAKNSTKNSHSLQSFLMDKY